MVHVGICIEGTNGCCGVNQLMDFSDEYTSADHVRWRNIKGSGETAALAYANLFENLMAFDWTVDQDGDDHNCAVVQMWFYKPADYNGRFDGQEYRAKELMELVAGVEGVLCLGEYKNPNSGNMIKGFQWAVQ